MATTDTLTPLTPLEQQALAYFREACDSPYQYETRIDKLGNTKQTKVPVDFPSYAGFAALRGLGKSSLLAALSPDVQAQCDAMIEHILLVNGMNGSYASALSVRATENIMGWSAKTTLTAITYTPTHDDLLLLQQAGIAIAPKLLEGTATRL